jgi:hypothetical protein
MKLDNYKNIKKNEWQEIASQFGIKYEEKSVVRYLVEKIAEKIGVDDKIVSDNELKRQVVEKLNDDYEVVPIEQIEVVDIEEDDVVTNVEDNVVTNVEDVEKPTVPELSRLEQLRLECESYGVSWSEIHTEQNLEQVLNGVKSAGVQPIKEIGTSITPVSQTINTNEAFEINSTNAVDVAQAVSNQQISNPAFNPLATPPPPIIHGGYKNSNAYLDTYKNIYLNAIRGHWRTLSVNEINEMILRDVQTFKHQVNLHTQQQNKAEIILTDGNFSVRIPSDNTNDWLDING